MPTFIKFDDAGYRPGTTEFLAILDEVRQMHLRKTLDYGTDDDALSNISDFLGDPVVGGLVLSIVNHVLIRGAMNGLVGLTAMDPDGDYLRNLNGRLPSVVAPGTVAATEAAAVPEVTRLRSIATDFAPPFQGGFVGAALDRTIDLCFGGLRNDRVVPTANTHVVGNRTLVAPADRLVLDSSRGVHHTSFWSNERVQRQLDAWLPGFEGSLDADPVPAAENDAGVEWAEAPEGITVESVLRAAQSIASLPGEGRRVLRETFGTDVAPPSVPYGTRPAVVIIPGIMGSHLASERGNRRIWFDLNRIGRGGLSELRWPSVPGAIVPTGVHPTYGPLVARLAAERDVYLFPYDWRAPIRDSATALATFLRDEVGIEPGANDDGRARPVDLVAHSMGGLVARTLPSVDRSTWDGTRRLVMLATPNLGSYSAALILTGDDLVTKAISLADLTQSSEAIRSIVTSFPAVYDLLPSPHAAPGDDDHTALFGRDAWPPSTRSVPPKRLGLNRLVSSNSKTELSSLGISSGLPPLGPTTKATMGSNNWRVLPDDRTQG